MQDEAANFPSVDRVGKQVKKEFSLNCVTATERVDRKKTEKMRREKVGKTRFLAYRESCGCW